MVILTTVREALQYRWILNAKKWKLHPVRGFGDLSIEYEFESP